MKKLMGVPLCFVALGLPVHGSEIKSFKIQQDACPSQQYPCECVGTCSQAGTCATQSQCVTDGCANTCGTSISPANESTIYTIPSGLPFACPSGDAPILVSNALTTPTNFSWWTCTSGISYPSSPTQDILPSPNQGNTYVMQDMIFSCPAGGPPAPSGNGVYKCK
jgi:hypothetical protein